MLNGGEHVNQMFLRAQLRTQQFYRQLVAQGKKQGDIAPDIDEELAAYLFDVFISDLGRFMIDKVARERGDHWQGNQTFFELPEVKNTFTQTLRILEFGMGNDHR